MGNPSVFLFVVFQDGQGQHAPVFSATQAGKTLHVHMELGRQVWICLLLLRFLDIKSTTKVGTEKTLNM